MQRCTCMPAGVAWAREVRDISECVFSTKHCCTVCIPAAPEHWHLLGTEVPAGCGWRSPERMRRQGATRSVQKNGSSLSIFYLCFRVPGVQVSLSVWVASSFLVRGYYNLFGFLAALLIIFARYVFFMLICTGIFSFVIVFKSVRWWQVICFLFLGCAVFFAMPICFTSGSLILSPKAQAKSYHLSAETKAARSSIPFETRQLKLCVWWRNQVPFAVRIRNVKLTGPLVSYYILHNLCYVPSGIADLFLIPEIVPHYIIIRL